MSSKLFSDSTNFEDVSHYKKIFEIQKKGDWSGANKLIKKINDPLLIGHVLAQRYLHPTKYRSKYKELKEWLNVYSDHPDARQIYKLALKRKPPKWNSPKKPLPFLYAESTQVMKDTFPARKKLSASKRRKATRIKRKIKDFLRKGYTKAVKKIILNKEISNLFTNFEIDQAKARLAAGYFAAGRDEWALMWSEEAAKRSGKYLAEANWTAGLASWRLGDRSLAARYFKAATQANGGSDWLKSAAAFWCSRAYLVEGRPERVNPMLQNAAAYPRTFYGLLARKILDLPITFSWIVPEIDKNSINSLTKSPAGKRALALLKVGETQRAERELRDLSKRSNEKTSIGILALATRVNMPSLAVRLNQRLFPNGGGFDGAAYPLPNWEPKGGYSVDKALVFALIHQESAFNPRAKSWAGARGLMQLMPRTAGFVARNRNYHRADSTLRELFDPETNIMLGQKYIKILLQDKKINGDLFLMATAWNGGPGNLNKWRRNINHMNDPLFFIESIPSRETRIFIEKVLSNLWIYRLRLGQPTPSLDAIAAGQWPVYKSLDNAPTQLAGN